MKKDYSIVALMLGALLLCVGSLQAAEGLNVSYTYTEPSEGDLEDEVWQHEVKVNGAVKVMHAEDHGFDLFVGGKFQANIWSFDDDRIDDIDMYKVMIPVGVGFKATDNILMHVEVAPGIHSDWENVDGDDFRVDGSVVGTYLYSPDLQFVLGVGVGEKFGDVSAYPIAGARWQATDELLMELIFPAPKVSYALSEDLRLFAAGEPTGGEWNVGEQDEDEGDVDLSVKGYRVGIGGEYQVMPGGWLYAMAGAEGGRELQLGINDEEVFDDDVDLDDCAFVQIGFRLR
jgi:hypothetical protein